MPTEENIETNFLHLPVRTVPNRVREIRLAQGLQMQQLAASAGLSRGWLSAIELYYVVPGEKKRRGLALALGVRESTLWPTLPNGKNHRIWQEEDYGLC